MTLVSNSRTDKVMVFIDIRNMMKSVATIGPSLWLDYKLMTRTLVGGRELVAAYVFDTEKPYGMDDRSRRMHDSLSFQGFRVMTRDAYDPIKKEQKEVDVAMACEMLSHALHDHYDVAIVVSGDGDFVPAVQHVQAAGKRVEVAAFSKSLNQRLRRFADRCYDLEKYPFLAFSNYPNERSLAAEAEEKKDGDGEKTQTADAGAKDGASEEPADKDVAKEEAER